MTLPATRNTTYVANVTPVKAADLNDIQDQIIVLNGDIWYWQTIARGTTETNIAYDGGDILHASANAAIVTFSAGLIEVGKRIKAIGAKVKGTGGTQNVLVALYRSDGDGSSTPIGTITIVNPPNAWTEYTFTLAAEDLVVAGKAYYWVANIPLLNTYLSNVGLQADKS